VVFVPRGPAPHPSPEQQERLALERVARGHEVVLELDHERVDVDLVAVERELARLADRVTLGVELAEADARALMSLGAGRLIEHHEAGAPFGVTEEADSRLESLIARRQLANLRVALRELTLDGATRLQNEPVGQIDTSGGRGDEDERPHEPGAERAHGRFLDGTWGRLSSPNIWSDATAGNSGRT